MYGPGLYPARQGIHSLDELWPRAADADGSKRSAEVDCQQCLQQKHSHSIGAIHRQFVPIFLSFYRFASLLFSFCLTKYVALQLV